MKSAFFSKSRYSFFGTLASLLLLFFGFAPASLAAVGDLETGYAAHTQIGRIARYDGTGALEAGYPTGSAFNGDVRVVLRQADGKLLVGGSFTSYDGTSRNRIARLNANGTLDGTFDPGTGFDGTVYDLVLDGTDVYAAGSFTSFNGTTRNYIARLNTDGTLDTGFAPSGTGLDATVESIVLDGTDIYAGGDFTSFNGTSRNGIVRLNTDGTLDAGFDPGTGFTGGVYKLLLSGTDVYAAGVFTSYNGTSRANVLRINTDGSIDNGFAPTGTGLNASVTAFVLDGTDLYVGGNFVNYNGTSRQHIARLNDDGTLDVGFDPGVSGLGGSPYSMVMDGTDLYVGGNFSAYAGVTHNNIVRINTDGSADAGFDTTSTSPDSTVYSVILDGVNVVAGGGFVGSLSEGFNGTVRAVLRQSDGKTLVGGDFTSFNGTSRNRIARLDTDGTLDATFDPGTGFNGAVYSLVLDGTDVYVGGAFTSFNGTARNYIARLNTDGTLDAGFAPTGTGLDGYVYATALSGTDVYVGGSFAHYNGTTRGYVARLNTDGTLDAGFAPTGTGFDDIVESVVFDGTRLVAGGRFTSFNGTSRNNIARLNADGTLDATFDPGTGFDGDVLSTAMSGTDVYVGGAFTTFNGTTRNYIARLNSDGTLDTSFAPTGTGFNGTVRSLLLSGTDVYVGGSFSGFNGSTRASVARLETNGTLDTAFVPQGTGFSGSVYGLTFDGTKLIAGGSFISFNSIARHYIAALTFAVPGFTRSPSTLTVSESSGTDQSISVVLDAQPQGDVVISAVAGDVGEATVAPATRTFTIANWLTPQYFTVSGVDDAIVDGDQTSSITLSVVDLSSSNEFDAVADQTVTVTTSDNDGGGGGGGEGNNTITVLSPNGGETFQASQQKQITWQYGGSANHSVVVWLSTNGGTSYTELASIGQPDPGIYLWTVPNTGTTAAKIKVDFIQNNAIVVSDTSNAAFTIVGTVAPPQPPQGGGGGDAGAGNTPTQPQGGVFTASANINEDLGIVAAAAPTPCVSGSLIRTLSQSAVYYCGANGKRYVFPNEKIYLSWYADFSSVQVVSAEQMASAMLGGNVTYKPGSRMIKIESDPKVYVVSRGGLLRWVPTEAIASRLYGATWNKSIDDVSVSFFPNYHFGPDITAAEVP